MWFLILQRDIFGNWTKNGGNYFSTKIHNLPNEERHYYLECDVTALLITSVPEMGINDITLVHLCKGGNTVSCSAL